MHISLSAETTQHATEVAKCRKSLSGAAQESNLPTDGLRRLTGFEDYAEDASLQGLFDSCAS